ncbi:MAG: arginine repressor [Oscillospiraceae bacterium]|nr:arginine repressor [Oscillospiraceae bacterium]
MKKERQEAILKLISEEVIETQEELIKKLCEKGFDVTQATVSRDIRELRISKVQTNTGYRYFSNDNAETKLGNKYLEILKQSVKNVDFAGNIAVVKCYTGTANAACAAVDSIHTADIVGTLAGDDTIFVLLKNEDTAKDFVEKFRKYYI